MQDTQEKSSSRLVVLGTGGTISGRSARGGDNLGYEVGQVGVADLVADLEPLAGAGIGLVTEQLAQEDSKDMGVAVWQRLALRCQECLDQPDVIGVVVTHGTDTMEETAYFLHRVLAFGNGRSKPVVLTGAMRPASSLSPDGPGNLRDALAVASHPGASGVLVVMAGKVFAGAEVQKVHGYRLDAFAAPDIGPLAYVEEGAVRAVRPWPVAQAAAAAGSDAGWRTGTWPRVEIVMSYAGATAFAVDALLAHAPVADDRVRGIVVAGTGNGTLHRDLEAALVRASAQGVAVVRSTRCSEGRVLAGAKDLFPDSHGLPPVKARIAMMLEMLGAAGPARAS